MTDLAAYTPAPHVTQHATVIKSSARGRCGMVVCQSRAAAEAGVAVLNAGGNAADAAVATAFALATAEPWNSGLGGIGFAVVHRAGRCEAEVIDFGPVASAETDPGAYALTGSSKQDLFSWPEVAGDRNIHGPLSFVIPSAVAGYDLLRERFGTGMPLPELMGPAVALARRGLPRDWFTLLKVASAARVLRLYPESTRLYLPDGLPPVPPSQGSPDFLFQGALADTLSRLACNGLRDFYEGGVAADLAADIAAIGGVVSARDLAGCRATIRSAKSLDWRSTHTVHVAGGLTAAPTLAAVMLALSTVRPGSKPDAAWFGAVSRALRAAYVDRLSGLGASTEGGETCTTHINVVDAEGNMVAMTTTLLSSMGSRVVLPRTGILMNNGVMWFDPAPGSANAIRPGARPLCNMCPVIVSRRGQPGPMIAAGASGGRRILASVVQLLAFNLDFGLSLEEAAHHPRIDVSGPDSVTADRRLPRSVLDALAGDNLLEAVEHSVLPVNFACPSLIRVDGGEAIGISDVMSPWSAALAV